jgi:hypothetical protein
MASPSRHPNAGADSDRDSNAGVARWMKVAGLLVAVAILLLVVMLAMGGSGHKPPRHDLSGSRSDSLSPTGSR